MNAATMSLTTYLATHRVPCRGERHIWQHNTPRPEPEARCNCGLLTWAEAQAQERETVTMDFGEETRSDD